MAYQLISNLKAEDVMSGDFVTATEEETLSDVLAKLKKHDIQELPVVRKNRLIGLVSYDTLIKRRNLPLSTKVEHIMTKPPELQKAAPLSSVAEMMMSSGFRSLPITSKGRKLVGMVSRSDMLKGIMQDKDISNMEISSLMTHEPQCVNKNDNITHARTLMKRLSMRTLPVVDDSEKVVGVVGVKDIARIWTPKTKESKGELTGEKISLDVTIESIMSSPPICMGAEGRVSDVISLLQKHDISNVLITDEGKPVGIITSLDLIELLVREKERDSLYVQITGLDEEDAEFYDDMDFLIQKYMSKVYKIEKPKIFALHVVQYHDRSLVKEYELRARLSTEKQMFYARSKGWELMRALDEILDALERKVTKEKERRVDAIKKLSK